MPSDRVTISLFSKEIGPVKFNEQLFQQKDNIRILAEKMSRAAIKQGKEPPEIIVSILLIPDWGKNNGYDNPEYQKTKEAFFKRAHEEFSDINVKIHDFYEEGSLTAHEKAYLHQLKALGSNADIIKTRALLNNQDRHHLQIDSNTIINDADAFYQETFGAAEKDQKDALNASYYDTAYVSAHNKVIYTTPSGKVAAALAPAYHDYIALHQTDMQDKEPHKNSIYSKIFAPALSTVGLTYDNFDIAGGWHFYPACISEPEYRITKHVATAINMSWAATDAGEGLHLHAKALKDLAPLDYQGVSYDFQSFAYIIKKYTGQLMRHALAVENPEVFYAQLLSISDNKLDLEILSSFYRKAVKAHPELTNALASVFPNTPKGNLLTQALFGWPVSGLRFCPSSELRGLPISDKMVDALMGPLVKIDKRIIKGKPDYRRAPEYIARTVFEKITGYHFGRDGKQSSFDEKLYQFLLAVEKGTETAQFIIRYQRMMESDVPTALKEKAIVEAERILTQGCGRESHFNYIPQRKRNLHTLQSLTRSQRPTQETFQREESVPEQRHGLHFLLVPNAKKQIRRKRIMIGGSEKRNNPYF